MARLGTYWTFVIFVLLYVLTIALMAPNGGTMAAYNLTPDAYRVLLITTVAVPAFMTWLAAFYGYDELRRYTALVKDSKEGEAFTLITKGSKWIALYLPLTSLVALMLTAVANKHSEFRSFGQIVVMYLTIAVALIAFTSISSGARLLSDRLKTRPTALKTRVMGLGFIMMGVLYCYTVVHKTLASNILPYNIPLKLLLLTVVVPLFYAWLLGLLAALDLDSYAYKVKGVLYQKSIRGLSAGILTIVASSVLLQYLNSASAPRGRLVLGWMLLLRYVLYVGLAAGFVLIARSAKKLQQIEKI